MQIFKTPCSWLYFGIRYIINFSSHSDETSDMNNLIQDKLALAHKFSQIKG